MRSALILPDHPTKTISGFTLPEMAMVLVIVGLMMAGWIGYYSVYVKQRDIVKAKDNTALLVKDIDSFRVPNGRFPCPARMDLPRTDFRFGRSFASTCTQAQIEDRSCAPQDAFCDPSLPPFNLNTAALSAGTPVLCSNGICIALGVRDSRAPLGQNDPIIIGALPIRDMADIDSDTTMRPPRGIGEQATRLSEQGYEADSIDPWGNQYTYAVTLSMTEAGQFRYYDGVIGLQDEFGQPTGGINNDGHYVIVSHGPNRSGGFSALTGLNDVPCAPLANGVDNENCDNDGVFVRALGNYEANGAAYYDDVVRGRGPLPGIIWTEIPGTGSPPDMRNLNTGFIGVGTGTPGEQLEVSGDLRVTTPATGTPPVPVRATLVCDPTGNDFCFPIESITSATGISCPAGQVLKGVKGGTTRGDPLVPICAPGFSTLVPGQSCPVGPPREWIVGIRSDGTIICAP